MIYTLPIVNWHIALAETIANAQNGDIIQVQNQNQVELGQRALFRMAPEKQVTFQVIVTKSTT